MDIRLHILIYWVWYFLTRRQADWPFFGNLIYGAYIIVVVQGDLLQKYGLDSRFTTFNLYLMLAGIVLHHLTVLSQKKGFGVVKLEKIHAQISHFLFFVPYGLNSLLAGLFFKDYGFTLISFLVALAGVLVGFKKLKLPY